MSHLPPLLRRALATTTTASPSADVGATTSMATTTTAPNSTSNATTLFSSATFFSTTGERAHVSAAMTTAALDTPLAPTTARQMEVLRFGGDAAFDAHLLRRGARAYEHALQRTKDLVAAGTTVIWAVDLDNTLYDTRARTLAIGKAFDAASGSSWFARISLDDLCQIGTDGQATAKRLGMTDDDAKAFTAHWDVAFWNPANLAHDAELPDVIAKVRALLDAGAVIRYVTGRAEQWTDEATGQTLSYRADTLARLRKSGLPASDETLLLKPDVGLATSAFKRDALLAMQGNDGAVVAGFLTDTLHELIAMRHVESIPCFWVRTSFEVARHRATPPWVYHLPQVL